MKIQLLKAPYEGELKIGSTSLTVAVLEDGTRLISRNAIFKAFGRTKRGRAKDETRVEGMPSFIDAKNLQHLISSELADMLANPIECRTASGNKIDGYKAEVLPLLCDVYLEARRVPKLLKTAQMPLADAAEIIVRSLSKIGIVALIDEATGYQYEREKDELQKILSSYISKDLLQWERTFQPDFYKEIFRLNGWDFTVKGINQRPGIIGTWTKQLIYQQLPKPVFPALKKGTPKGKRLHQKLSPDIGRPHLERQLLSVTTLMNVSDDWKGFMKLWNKKFGQLEIDFPEPPKDINPKPPLADFDKTLKGLLNTPPPPKDKGKGENKDDEENGDENDATEKPKPKKPKK